MSDVPFGEAVWEEIGRMEESAEADPEGFAAYQDHIDAANAEHYPDGDGEV